MTGGCSESPVIGSDRGCGEASIDDGSSMLHEETNASRTKKPGAVSTPLTITSLRNNNGVREVIGSTPNMAYETPTRRLGTPSKFVFLSDRKSVPTEFKNLQERTIKRRRDFVARVHDLVRTVHGQKIITCRSSDREHHP
jgi:hypothetical protein